MPRKSNVSVVSNAGADEAANNPDAAQTPNKPSKDGVGIDDLTLPKSMIARLAKGVLPPNTQIQKDALLALHKSATVFVSYITNGANEFTQSNMKKTIVPQDVMSAIKDAEFEGFLPRLEAELKKYNDIQCDKRNSYRHRVKQEKAAAGVSAPAVEGAAQDTTMTADDSVVIATPNGDVDGERPAKKFKGEEGEAILPSNGDAQVAAGSNLPQSDDEAVDDEDDIPEESDDDVDQDEDIIDGPEEIDEDAELQESILNPNGIHDEALDEPDSD